jgi:hypothetical protein
MSLEYEGFSLQVSKCQDSVLHFLTTKLKGSYIFEYLCSAEDISKVFPNWRPLRSFWRSLTLNFGSNVSFTLGLTADALVLLPELLFELPVLLLDGACCRHLCGAESSMPILFLHNEHTGIPHFLLGATSYEQT